MTAKLLGLKGTEHQQEKKARNQLEKTVSGSGQSAEARRRWWFRALTLVVVPVVLLCGIEGILRLAGYGYPTGFFQTRSVDGHKVVVQNDQFSRRFFPVHLVRRPLPVSFSPVKGKDVYRVFVLGESAAMGDPNPAFSFSRIMEALLRDRFPGKRFEVINVAFTAINSHVILPIARDCARQNGDLWVIYMGHNEVQGPFGPGTVFGANPSRLWLIRASLALKSTRLGQLLEAIGSRWRERGGTPRSWQGLEMFLNNQVRQDDPRLAAMYRNYQHNLEDILRVGHQHGAQIVLCTPGSNLKDSAPFASLHSVQLRPEQQSTWETRYREAVAAEASARLQEAFAGFQKASELDPSFADLEFRLGRCCLALRQPDAGRHFERARDLDTLRFRTDSHLEQIIRQTAARWQGKDVFLCDTRQELNRATADGIPGDDLFFDHVHLNFDGNYVLAKALAEQVSQRLPTDFTRKDTGHWAEADACARSLALTGWNQFEMCEAMQRRLLKAPFTNQLNHLTRQQRYRQKLAELRPNLQPEALEQAAQSCREAITQAPDDPTLHDNYARLLAFDGQDAAAAAEFERVTELLPQDASAYSNIGLLMQKQGRAAEAEKYFRLALVQRPGFADACNGLGLIRASKGDFAAAVDLYRRALADNPELVEAEVNLGQALEKLGRLNEATNCYQEALALRPNFAPAHLGLADAYLRQGEYFNAIPHLSDAAKAQPELALARVNKAIQLQPGNPIEYFKKANVLAALNEPNEAVESLRTAVRLNTNCWQARYLLGVELANHDQLAAAQNEFAAVVRLQPTFVRGHVNYGVALARQLRLEEAADQFREALRLEPTNQAALQFLVKLAALTNSAPASKR